MKFISLKTLLCIGIYAFPLYAASTLQDDSSNLVRDPKLISRNDIRMNGDTFFTAWISKKNPQEQLKANMYLLGVMDATEGKAWCGYNIALPGALRESVYSYFNKLTAEQKKEPAFVLISDALTLDLPCAKKEKKA